MYTNNQISKTKWQNLLTPVDKISTDFIDRQLRESQYIARKAKEILTSICYNVTATSGSVTSFLRHVWGWDTVLHDLNFDRYKKAGLTEVIEVNHRGSVIRREQIRIGVRDSIIATMPLMHLRLPVPNRRIFSA